MAGEDIINYAGNAAIAYNDALTEARNTQNALLRQYGFTAPGAGGAYTVEGAQQAFNPASLLNKTTGEIDTTKLSQLSGGLQVGSSGAIANTMRQGATLEANVASEAAARGLSGEIGGGLMQQRRDLAEAQAAEATSAVKGEFLAGIGRALAPVGEKFKEAKEADIKTRGAILGAEAAKNTIAEPIDYSSLNEPTGANKPHQYQRRTNQYGVKQQYIGGKWKKVK